MVSWEALYTPPANELHFRQASGEAIFRCAGSGGNDLFCVSGCGQILIENMRKGAVIGIAIECSRCGNISRTPYLEDGEILSSGAKCCNGNNAVNVDETIVIEEDSSVVGKGYFDYIRDISGPRRPILPEIELSVSGINKIREDYEKYFNTSLESQLRKIGLSAIDACVKYPFAWATDILLRRISGESLHHQQFNFAITIINLFNNSVRIWGHHPNYSRFVGKENDFYHTAFKLIVANHLWESGNSVGISNEERDGSPNLDLVVKDRRGRLINLEVKSPKGLRWTPDASARMNDEEVKKQIRLAIERSYRQIRKDREGILIIASSLVNESLPPAMDKCVVSYLKSKGRDHRSLIAVITTSPTNIKKSYDGDCLIPEQSAINYIFCNPHYRGKSTLNLKRDAIHFSIDEGTSIEFQRNW